MKSLLLLLALISFNVFSAECRQSICVGDTVIDNSNDVGKVTGFPEENYARVSYSYSKGDVLLSKLSAEVPSIDQFQQGISVIDRDNTVGIVDKVFANKKVRYIAYNTYYFATTDNLGHEVSDIGEFKTKIYVIDSSNDVGVVDKVFSNNKVRYIAYNTYYFASVDKLAYEVKNLDNLKKDTVVLTTENDVGVVDKVFSNNKVRYVAYSTYYFADASKLAHEVTSLGDLKKSTVIISEGNDVGVVDKVFSNNKVRYIAYNTYYFADANKLAHEVTSLGNLKNSTVVINEGNDVGVVDKLFSNNKVRYVAYSSYYFAPANKLSHEVPSQDGLQKGVVVVNKQNDIGTVDKVFSNNKVRYIAYSSYYVTLGDQLSAEVETHPTYNKSTVYASDYYLVGVPKRFFKNGMVEHMGRAVSKLYTEVDLLNDLKVNDTVFNHDINGATVLKMFENGTVAYKLHTPKKGEEKLTYSAKLTDFTLLTDPAMIAESQKNEEKTWIINLAAKLKPDAWSYRQTNLVISQNDFASYKKRMFERLKSDKNLISNQEDRNAVLRYLSISSDSNVFYTVQCKISYDSVTQSIKIGSGISSSNQKTTAHSSTETVSCFDQSAGETLEFEQKFNCNFNRFSIDLVLSKDFNAKIKADLHVTPAGEDSSNETLIASQSIDPLLSSLIMISGETDSSISENRLSKKEIEKKVVTKAFATCSVTPNSK